MTCNNKTMQTILFAGLIMTLMIPVSGIRGANAVELTAPSTDNSNAQNTDALRQKLAQLQPSSEEYFNLVKRGPLTDAEFSHAKQIVLSDENVKNLMKADSFNVYAYSFLGNVGQVPVKWNPVIHGMVGDQTVSVVVDLDNNKVVKMEHTKTEKLAVASNHAYATDQYVSSSTTRGLKMTTPNQPTGYVGSTNYSGYSGFSLNAVMTNSVTNDACTPAKFPNSYIMQAGYIFKNNGWFIVFADTLTGTGCSATIAPLPQPLTTDDIEFTVYASGGIWNGVIQNLRTLDTQYFTRTGLPSSTLQTNTYATGVFMENAYASSGWDSQFSPKSIAATNAKFKNSSNVWTSWSSDSKYVVDCHGSTQTSNNPISNSLTAGGTATWNITTMTSWPSC